MIISNSNITYDYNGHYYYLTATGLTNLSLVPEGSWGSLTTRRLKAQGQQLHELYVKSPYNERYGYSKKDLIEYKVFKNEHEEVNAITQALVNYANLADYSRADFTYMETGKMQKLVLTPLKNARVYIVGEVMGVVPEAELGVGY